MKNQLFDFSNLKPLDAITRIFCDQVYSATISAVTQDEIHCYVFHGQPRSMYFNFETGVSTAGSGYGFLVNRPFKEVQTNKDAANQLRLELRSCLNDEKLNPLTREAILQSFQEG